MIDEKEIFRRLRWQYKKSLLSRICTAAAELSGLNQDALNATYDAHKLLVALDALRTELAWWLAEEAKDNAS